MIWILVTIVFLILSMIYLQIHLSAPLYKGPVSDHFDGKTFINYGNVKQGGFNNLIKWMISRKKGDWSRASEEVKPIVPQRKVETGIKLTFVNHTTFLIQFNSINILTDPVWSKRASPFQWLGPKRQTPPGINFNDLPQIDYILLTHNHYDHLDIDTLKNLDHQFTPIIITALGVGAYLRKEGIRNVREMDWWEELSFENFKVLSVPAQHFSGRSMVDRNRTLWCGFIIECNHKTIYFAGDTGYGIHFNLIKDRFPKIDIGLLPIGAYKPSWFMSPIHISPEEAVKIHKELSIGKSIATHFGTFALADEGRNEPLKDLKKNLKTEQVKEEEFVALRNGEFVEIN